MQTFDLEAEGLRALNSTLHAQKEHTNATAWEIINPKGSHALAVGVDAPLDITVRGSTGYYCAGMNKLATIRIKGNAGPGVAENMMSGSVIIEVRTDAPSVQKILNEVESEIDEIDGVLESAVVGVPHPDFGEGVVAVVVTEPGKVVSEAAVLEALDDRLARFKQPKRVMFVDQLPRNTMGKVQKKSFRDGYANLLSTDLLSE